MCDLQMTTGSVTTTTITVVVTGTREIAVATAARKSSTTTALTAIVWTQLRLAQACVAPPTTSEMGQCYIVSSSVTKWPSAICEQ